MGLPGVRRATKLLMELLPISMTSAVRMMRQIVAWGCLVHGLFAKLAWRRFGRLLALQPTESAPPHLMTQVIESIQEMQAAVIRLKTDGRRVAWVPTSGCLHPGHFSLIEAARQQADCVVVSVFLHTRTFGANEDAARYPRTPEADAAACERLGVDILFTPREESLLPEGFSTMVAEDHVSAGLCGVSRPHYLRWAITLHVLLLQLVRPDWIVFGRRDPQLAAVMRKVVRDLFYPVEILCLPIVREADGLPYNARNRFLNDFQRRDAVLIPRALQKGADLVAAGITHVDRIMAEVTHQMAHSRRLRLIYVAVVDPDTMEPLRKIIPGQTLICVAVWCDEVRLLDSILL